MSAIDLFALKLEDNRFFGEPWRLLTGHWVHAGWEHLLLNLVNLVLLRLAFRQWPGSGQLYGFMLYAAVLIGIGLWLTTSLKFYVGFSGILHGLLIYLLLLHWNQYRVVFGLAIIVVVGKVISEQLYGANPLSTAVIGLSIATEAHVFGVISGFSFWLFAAVYNGVLYRREVDSE